MRNFRLLFFIGSLVLQSCIDQPNDGIPSYLRINDVELETKNNANFNQGANSHLIQALWVNIGGNLNGVYEVPAHFPILKEGATQIELQAGIKRNGSSTNLVIYPFYFPDTLQTNLVEKTVTEYRPVFKYINGAKFPINESFDDGNIFDNNLELETNTNLTFGNSGRSGKLCLTEQDSTLKSTTSQSIRLDNPSEYYIELDYRNEVFFSVGLIGTDATGVNIDIEKLFIGPKADWNKIYIDVTEEVNNLQVETFNFYVKASLGDSLSTANVYIDNFKLVHL